RRDIESYRAAVEAYLEQDWPKAVELLGAVYERTPNFRDTRSMLGQAHCQLAEQLIGADELDAALNEAQVCEEILQGTDEASALVQRVKDEIRPPRRIEATLSEFLVRVYEDNVVVKTFPMCHGRPSHATAPGRYKVQTKTEYAYATTWDMGLPYWLGIYWAGGTENGFHALPILSNGSTLWAGALGTQCSFGCLVLNTPDAIWLYNWASLGTVVFINP
ncbi:MAG: L,D-transpeptidase, partial [Chloroflexi bacterium]|nr:L,D-transpeptidase [Chloroflexota bacterium]